MIDENIHCGKTTSKTIRYQREATSKQHLETIDVAVTERDWDVTDSEARLSAAVIEVGEFGDGYHFDNVAWFIDSERNAAALLVYRVPGSRSATLVCGAT